MVSVLINNYNYASYIEEAVKSVLNQTYNDWELIIVDDGSGDDSKEIIHRYEALYPERIIAVCKENGGQASALNAGFALAKGDIIAFLDSDDYWYPNKLEIIVSAHKEHDYVVNNFETNGPEKSFCNKQFIARSSYLLKKYGYQVLTSTPTSSISFKKSLLDKFFPVPEEEYRISADGYVDLFALYFSDYFYIDEKLTFYRFHNLNGYYGKENSYDTYKYVYNVIKNVNTELEKQGFPQIPYRTIATQKAMYKEMDQFEIREGERYVVYGAGDIGEHVIQLIEYCNGKVYCFCDGNKDKRNQVYLGYKILLPDDLMEQRDHFDKIIIASTFYGEAMASKLKTLGFEKGKDYIETSLFCGIVFDEYMEG